jgi:ribose-phosphate pyrophosphokinase
MAAAAAGTARAIVSSPVSCRRRSSPRCSCLATRVLGVVGDVRDRPCVIVDDILATGGTIVEAIDALRLAGARPSTLVAVVHALLLDDAADRFAKAAVREIVATDTVCHPEIPEPQLRIGTVAPLIGSALTRLLEP